MQCDSCGAIMPGENSAGTDPAVNGEHRSLRLVPQSAGT